MGGAEVRGGGAGPWWGGGELAMRDGQMGKGRKTATEAGCVRERDAVLLFFFLFGLGFCGYEHGKL